MHDYLGPIDSAGRPVELGMALWSSTGSAWGGFHLEILRQARDGRLHDLNDRCVGLAMTLSGTSEVTAQLDRTYTRTLASPGSIVLSGRNYHWRRYDYTGSTDLLFVQLDLSRTRGLILPGESLSELVPERQLHIRDIQTEALLACMLLEARAGAPAGLLYGQSLSLALAARIQNRFSLQAPPQKVVATLTNAQLTRVYEYIECHLAKEISLGELATLLKLSSSHFCQLFKNTTGIPPYHYVLEQRIARSKSLLVSKRASIAEVSQIMGFADQSHFCRVFKKISNVSPKQFQLKAK